MRPMSLASDIRHIAMRSTTRTFETLVCRSISGHRDSSLARPPSGHRLGPLHMPLVAKVVRHCAVSVPIVPITGVVPMGLRVAPAGAAARCRAELEHLQKVRLLAARPQLRVA